MNNFKSQLNDKIYNSISNCYDDNLDVYRHRIHTKMNMLDKIRSKIFYNYTPNFVVEQQYKKYNNIKDKYADELENVYNLLNDQYSKDWLIDLIAYYILGHKKVKLKTNNVEYINSYKNVDKLIINENKIDVNFMNFVLRHFDLTSIGYPINLFFRNAGIVHDFILQQYNYRDSIKTESGDVVIDAGGCWGDTALYFAHKAGKNGKVYSFEFIPENLKIFKKNLELNPDIKSQIEIIEHPLWDTEDIETYYLDNGPGSKVSFEEFKDYTGKTYTISIDSFCERYNVEKVDFIKMDIEGAEPHALKGAINTIKKHKPKLAIANYHGLDDFVNIPQWINNLDLGYKIYLDHFTIHWEESIIFASID